MEGVDANADARCSRRARSALVASVVFSVNKVSVSRLRCAERGGNKKEPSVSPCASAAPQRGGGPEQSQSSKNLLTSVAADRPQGKFHRRNYVIAPKQ